MESWPDRLPGNDPQKWDALTIFLSDLDRCSHNLQASLLYESPVYLSVKVAEVHRCPQPFLLDIPRRLLCPHRRHKEPTRTEPPHDRVEQLLVFLPWYVGDRVEGGYTVETGGRQIQRRHVRMDEVHIR